MKSIKKYLPLVLLTLVAFILRVWKIDTNPPSLNWDEVSHAYNAYSLLKTGRDEWGTFLPLIFRAYGDYKLPLYIYLTTLPVALFGLTAFATRIISVLAGTLAIPGIYLLTNQLFSSAKKKQLEFKLGSKHGVLTPGLIAALLLTLMPWHFFISRPALEANLALTLFIFGAWALLKALKHPRYWLVSAILLALTLHTYNTYRIFTPLILFGFFLIYRSTIRKQKSKQLSGAVILFLLSLSLVVVQTISGTGTARYAKLAILTDQTVFQIGQDRSNSSLPPLISRVVHNRPVYFLTTFLSNYLNYFSPRFTYQVTGVQSQFAIPGKNLFSLPILSLALIGFIFTIRQITVKKLKGNGDLFLVLLLLASPVAAALTADPPQALRPTPLIIPSILFATLGFRQLVSLFPRYSWTKLILTASLTASLVFGFYRYHAAYWGDYRTQYSSSWQYGYHQAIDFLVQHQSEYDRIFISKAAGEPHLFYAFFTSLDPQAFQPNADNIRFSQSDWYWTDRIGQVYFVNDWQIPTFQPAPVLTLESGGSIPTTNSLLITSPQHLPSDTTVLAIIDNLQGDIAFVIARFNQ